MNKVIFLVTLGCATVSAQNIDLSNRVSTVTTLDRKTYTQVILLYGDLDGIVWRGEGASGGRICYTNVTLERLTELGIPTNRLAVALKRAGLKVISDTRYAAEGAALAQAYAKQRREAQERFQREQAERQKLAAAQAAKEAKIEQINSLKAAIARDEALSVLAWGYYVATPNDYSSVTLSSKGNSVDTAAIRRANARAIELRLRNERHALKDLQRE
jgi:hypothetical protein